jgi:uncharacterized membrane protein YfcA
MMRDSRLLEWKARGEVAYADLVFRARQRRQNRETVRVPERFEELCVVVKVVIDDLGGGCASLYRHTSILTLVSRIVNINVCEDGIAAGPAKGGAMATWVVLFIAAIFGGALNAVAGGGSFLTFPALLFVGVPPINANTTSTAALLPGVFASITGYRQDFPKATTFVLCLCVMSLIGGLAGAIFLLRTPEEAFRRLIPYLLGIATLTFILSKRISQWMGREERDITTPSPRALAGASLAQLVIAIYGGYFGGGMGIVMLATLGLMGMRNIHAMNAVKTLLAAIINTVAFVAFVFARNIVWPYAVVMLVGSVAGGYFGARYVRRFDQGLVRGFIAAVGIAMTVFFFVRQGF